MRLWPRSTTARISEAFAFLAEAGYRLVSDSGLGMGTTVTYRSPALWIAVNSDRGDTWVEVTPTGQPDDPYTEGLLHELLAGHATYEAEHPLTRRRSVEEAAAFVREHLGELEIRFRPERLAETRQQLAALRDARTAKTRGWLANLDRRAREARGQ
jgi:hypothetical protein